MGQRETCSLSVCIGSEIYQAGKMTGCSGMRKCWCSVVVVAGVVVLIAPNKDLGEIRAWQSVPRLY